MTINIYDKYAPNANPPDSNYPLGSIKDNTTTGSDDGTPLTSAWANDIEGCRQATLIEAGISPNGSSDTAMLSQVFEAQKIVFGTRTEIETQIAYVGELQAAGVTPAQLFDTAQNGNLHRSTAAGYVGCLDYGTIQNYEDYNSSINLADVEVVAHRGFSGVYPQNTMIAFTNCIKRGASSIELDLSVSSDGVVYVFHDSILDSIMEGTGTFTAVDSTYIDARKFQALNGTIFYLTEHIPRWVDVLKWAKRVGVKIYAEVKNVRTDADLALLVQPVLDQNMSAQVGFSSFTTSQLQTIRSLSPRSFILRNGTGTSWPTVITQLQAMGGNAALGWEKASVIAEPNIVTASAAAGIGLMPYTVFTVEEMKELTDLGVRRILCDVPMGASR